MERFQLFGMDEAFEKGYVNQEIYDADLFTGLFDMSENPPKLIAVDNGEPEDQTFGRDLYWVPDLLNELNNEIVELKKLNNDLQFSSANYQCMNLLGPKE